MKTHKKVKLSKSEYQTKRHFKDVCKAFGIKGLKNNINNVKKLSKK
ncbi:MAG: hypothetical protein IKO56_00925 [Alphaproteobacteria bacterium]|nr:hypothetical protein [Alphaproteobacteria bacterium]